MKLPSAFTEKMKAILGEEYPAFLDSYDQPRHYGLRVNTAKISTEEFERLAPFHLTPIPWVENGYYYEEQDQPSRHPFYFAGLYYLQEPSAMTPASRLEIIPGERVLDLCAAPGGKATELGAKLKGTGVLVANDISASRAKALLKNVEIFGIPNSFLLNEAPARIAGAFEGFFDKILVDAPCSGEGMFRKEPEVAKAWSEGKPQACAKQQKEILLQAARMLRPGGKLLYSTCTFSPEENEQIIQFLLEACPEFSLLDIEGYEGFEPGRPELAGGNPMLQKCVRIWPHKMAGEGHFLALLEKEGNSRQEGESGEERSAKNPERIRLTRQERQLLEDFLADVSMELEPSRIEVRKGQAYYLPDLPQISKGLSFVRNGLYLGEMKKDRFEPSQAFAMALGKEGYASLVNLPWTDERIMRYLKGETIQVEELPVKRENGWQLVCVNGYPLGWGKLVNGLLKNKYLSGWRIRS